jgi:hypothetical protein
MEITSISYARTVNLGDYNSEKLEMTASVETYDDPNEAAEKLKHVVHYALKLTTKKPKYVKQADIAEVVEGGDIVKTDGTTVEVDETTETVPEKPKKKAAKKAPAKKKAAKKEEKEEEKVYELAEVQAALKHLAKTKGLPVGKAVLKDFKVAKSAELKPEQFSAVMKAVEKCLK